MESAFWTASIPDGMSENEEQTSEYESSSYHVFEVLNADGEVERSVTISVDTEDALDYRQDIVSCGVELRNYADGNVETKEIGGYSFLQAERQYWGETEIVLKARDEGAQMSIEISVTGDFESEDVQSLINSLAFTLPDGNEVDAPYPWDGEPIVAETGTASIASYTIAAQQIMASESILPNTIFDNHIVVGNTLYALSDSHLHIFTLNGRMPFYRKMWNWKRIIPI